MKQTIAYEFAAQVAAFAREIVPAIIHCITEFIKHQKSC